MVKLEVMDNGAIYINGTRITNRSTKPYEFFHTKFEVNVHRSDVISTLKTNGFDISKIDPDYAREQNIVLDNG